MCEISKICGLYSHSYILKQYGFCYSEEHIFGFLELFGFEYGFIHNGDKLENRKSSQDIFSIVGILPYQEIDFNQMSKVEFYSQVFNKESDAVSAIEENISSTSPLIVFLDVYHLPYHPLYHVYHGQTNVLVHRYHSNEKRFWISDHHVPTMPVSCFEGWISRDDLLASILLKDNISHCHETGIIFHRVNELKKIKVLNIEKCIKNNFINFLTADKQNVGLEGMENLTTLILDLKKWNCVSDISKFMNSVYIHVTGRAGPVLSRRSMGKLLAEELHIENNFISIADMWQSVAIKAFRASINYKVHYLDTISMQIKEIVLLERQEVRDCIKKLK